MKKLKDYLSIFRCKFGYHEWVAVHWTEFNLVGQFFLRKAGEGKPSIIRNVM